jgi:pyruvate, orthophosphate dikinase
VLALPHYNKIGITKGNPFATIDQTGVGKLMKIAIEGGNKTRPGIKLGICGEHGGDPATIQFCYDIGLTYVSCSPFRVPVARLAAAQAALKASKQAKAAEAKATAPKSKAAAPKSKAAKPAKAKVVKAATKAPTKKLKAAKAR